MNQRDDLLVWMDLEMTAIIDVHADSIIEIALVITDADLNIVTESPDIVIHADRALFDRDDFVKNMHTTNGLLEVSVASTVTESDAEQKLLNVLQEYVVPKSSPLCGNSISTDRQFLKQRMPLVNAHLHYRHIDVSTIKELAKRWRPELYAEAEKMKENKSHRALDDIKGSIAELKFYREHWLK